MTRKMHIAASGKEAGKWVTCDATSKCRVGGTHTTSDSLQAAKKWANKNKISDITQEEYIGFLKDRLNTYSNAEELPKEPLFSQTETNILEAEQKHASNEFLRKMDERDARIAEVIAEEEARFETIKQIDFTVTGTEDNKTFNFTDKENNTISLDNKQVEVLFEELDTVSKNYSQALSDFFDRNENDTTDDLLKHDDKVHIKSLNKTITVEEAEMLHANIYTETQGYDLLSFHKKANAEAKISMEELLN
jgi:hypothetical protein